MKVALLALSLFSFWHARAQHPIEQANKCYTDKNYACAGEAYKRALAEKKYDPKNYATILFRIGFSLGEQKKNEESIQYFIDAIAAKPDFGEAYWSLAGNYYALLEYENASEQYGKAIETFKDNKQTLKALYYWRGNCYSALNKFTDALTYFKLAIAVDSTNGAYAMRAADVSYGLGKYNDAVTYYTKAIARGDADRQVMSDRYYWLGESYFKLSKFQDALTAFNGAQEYSSTNKSITWGIAGVYYNQAKWPEAIDYYSQAIIKFKADTASLRDLYYFRGRSYGMNNETAKAMADFDVLQKLDPGRRDIAWQRAYVYYRQKKYKEALPWYAKSIELYSDDKNSLDDLHYLRGNCYLQQKDSTNAKADFTRAISFNANNAEANIQLGHLSFAAAKYYEAKDYFSKISSFFNADSTEFSRIYFRKGFSNLVLGSTFLYTAKSDLQKSIAYDSTNKDAHRYMVNVWTAEKYYAAAEKTLNKCLDLYKNQKDSIAVFYLYRGNTRYNLKRYADALADYEQSDKMKKIMQPDYIRSMGQLAFEIKDYEKAITFFTRLQPLYKKEQTNELMFAYFARGRAYLEQKKKMAAITDLKKANELVPGNKEIETWLTKAEAL